MEQTIARTLRIGVTIAAILAVIGGVLYLWQHGAEPVPDYSQFSYDELPDGSDNYTTLDGIAASFFAFSAEGWIMVGVLVLILTPVMRVVLSLVGFAKQRDWLYVLITAFVLAVIIANSLGG
ncbi:MAG: DUF1634 domain-containing protein [Alloprevotella sp.]|nr:DUF1634 domain-containing protein [Alloprevotella sp.]